MAARFHLEDWRGHIPGLIGAKRGYAVLVPVVEDEDGKQSLLFEVRAKTLRRQPGEVCFPGGKMEQDETPIQCALRETWEELGIRPDAIEVIGETDFLCHQSGFLVRPVLGRVRRPGLAESRISPAEVDHIFFVPVRFLEETDPEVWTYPLLPEPPEDFPYERFQIARDYPWRKGQMEIPVYQYEGHTIWGMTARIVRHLFTG